MLASASSGWWITRSGPSATISSSSSVTSVAISTMTSWLGSRPVISRSIHTSTGVTLPVPFAGPPLTCSHRAASSASTRTCRCRRYARAGDAGLDLLARRRRRPRAGGGRAVVPTGVAVAIPDGFAGFVSPAAGSRCATA